MVSLKKLTDVGLTSFTYIMGSRLNEECDKEEGKGIITSFGEGLNPEENSGPDLFSFPVASSVRNSPLYK